MFIGHFAPAFVAAALTPQRPRLGLYFIAAQLVDWAFFALLLVGIEEMRVSPGITAMNPMDLYHMPYTHSLLGSAGFAVGFAVLAWLVTRDRLASVLAGCVVLSHWLLDLLVHRPDLTLAGNLPKLGLGLWNYPAVEMPLELALTFGALAFFLSRTRGPAGPAIVLGVLLLALQAVNWFGPEPEAVTPAISITAFFAYALATLGAWWLGHTRRAKR
ncbi:hypothetical protein [Citromicrobium sp. WPS32]|uniref:hypothetical protein n=1 Tax=Citromicrobium sp. WPS32 TaxID=1634517 RepID=UPI0006C90DF8|nr:hypothetical protein [Citromicrobium sp. WPS32]KPM13762.1 membrane protein [Citromicrobium sp. WPS32]|tara:strand:- start:3264 stop:3911 length:648 start_codon:yes stop_codon:yes gene_type:complete